MGGGASLADYDQGFRAVHKGGKGVFSATAVAAAGTVGLREEAAPAPAPAEREPNKVERTREVSDLMWRMNEYRTIKCDCGTKLKVPPKFKRSNIRCPHCGRINAVSK